MRFVVLAMLLLLPAGALAGPSRSIATKIGRTKSGPAILRQLGYSKTVSIRLAKSEFGAEVIAEARAAAADPTTFEAFFEENRAVHFLRGLLTDPVSYQSTYRGGRHMAAAHGIMYASSYLGTALGYALPDDRETFLEMQKPLKRSRKESPYLGLVLGMEGPARWGEDKEIVHISPLEVPDDRPFLRDVGLVDYRNGSYGDVRDGETLRWVSYEDFAAGNF